MKPEVYNMIDEMRLNFIRLILSAVAGGVVAYFLHENFFIEWGLIFLFATLIHHTWKLIIIVRKEGRF